MSTPENRGGRKAATRFTGAISLSSRLGRPALCAVAARGVFTTLGGTLAWAMALPVGSPARASTVGLIGLVLSQMMQTLSDSHGPLVVATNVGTVAAMVEQEALYYLTPFKYFETYYILMTSSYKPSFALAAALVTIGLVLTGFLVFIRRDVRAS